MNKCVFLDRDGVLNEEIGDYVYTLDKLLIPPGMPEALQRLKRAGYVLVVVTNQAGIAKGLYTAKEVEQCHQKIQEACSHVLDALYYCPYHPDYDSESIARKPGSLMLEKAIARFDIDTSQSWLVGDRQRDIEAGLKVGVEGIFITEGKEKCPIASYQAKSLYEAADIILETKKSKI
jgi:D-glycero-D-manno-heptose 1,7-bisphosphate phosphatase